MMKVTREHVNIRALVCMAHTMLAAAEQLSGVFSLSDVSDTATYVTPFVERTQFVMNSSYQP